MGKIYLGNSEIKKIYLGTNEVKKVYLGSTEVWGSGTPLPAWFPQNVNPVADLETYYGTNMSSYFVDVLYCENGKYAYSRCYCNTVNAVSVITNNMSPPTQLKCSYSGNNRQIAVRSVFYNSDGSYYTREQKNWSTSNITLMSPASSTIFTPSVCIIDWGNTTYTTWLPSGYSFEIIVV